MFLLVLNNDFARCKVAFILCLDTKSKKVTLLVHAVVWNLKN